ncbi:hypothetical protein GGI21_001457, partial [Coemansia aciculifera]
ISKCCDASVVSEEVYTDINTPASLANGQGEGEEEEAIVKVFEMESQDSIELARQAIERLREHQSESASKQNALNTQIFKLSAELFQTTSDKAALESTVKRLERDNGEYGQTIDELQQQMEALRSASNGEIAGLKERVRHVAGKIASVSDELAETRDKLDETKQVLGLVDSERTDLLGKCRGLESTVESLALRLDGEQQQHEKTKQALHMARDGNANEARRAELDAANCVLEQRCKGLADELALSKNRERLLLNSNRALEARLGDALRKLDDPTRLSGEDMLADHCRRNWDSSLLVESRRETADARRRLELAEAEVAGERRAADVLRGRVRELEAMHCLNEQQRGGQSSAKKRRLEEMSAASSVAAAAAVCEDGDFVVVTPVRDSCLRSYSYDDITASTTPSRVSNIPGSLRSAARNTVAGGGEMRQTVVDAGEHARDRRRKNDHSWISKPATPRIGLSADRPVTPRIVLHSDIPPVATPPHQQKRVHRAGMTPTTTPKQWR